MSEENLPPAVVDALALREQKLMSLKAWYAKEYAALQPGMRGPDGQPFAAAELRAMYLGHCSDLDAAYERTVEPFRLAYLQKYKGLPLRTALRLGYRSAVAGGGGAPIATPAGATTESRRTAPRARVKMGPKFGCLTLVAGIVAVFLLIAWIGNALNPTPPLALTKESGMATCQKLISKQANSGGDKNVLGDVMTGTLYKATVETVGLREVHRWTCRLEWTGSDWTTLDLYATTLDLYARKTAG